MKEITKEVYLKWYEDMQFWRKFEDKLAAVYIQQKVRGFLHLYNGQEAVLAGALHAMDLSKDKMITASLIMHKAYCFIGNKTRSHLDVIFEACGPLFSGPDYIIEIHDCSSLKLKNENVILGKLIEIDPKARE